MPHIIVMADADSDRTAGAVMLRERINPSDLQSTHFANHLIERLNWAVEDAREIELNESSGPIGGNSASGATVTTATAAVAAHQNPN